MGLTILEVLQNAEYNLKNPMNRLQKEIGIEQLSNAIYLLDEKNKNIHDDFNEDDLKNKDI